MKKINYKFCDGTQQQIEVSDEFYNTYETMEKELCSNNRRETRRHISLNYLNEFNIEPVDTTSDLFVCLSQKLDNKELEMAISKLNPAQQTLLRRVYFLNEQMSDIAKELGVSKSAITQQMQVILAHLKKYLKNF